MNTEKLTTIDDAALDGVAGGGPGEVLGKVWDAHVQAGLKSAGISFGAIEQRAGVMKDLMAELQKIFK
jgi:hypothetical protein